MMLLASMAMATSLATFQSILGCKATDRNLSSRLTRSVVFPINRISRFKINASLRSQDYTKLSKELMENENGAGEPPRWFSPLECGCSSTDSPLLLFLPGIDGVGFGLMLHHQRLGGIFDIWCLHIPTVDRTPLADLVMLVQSTVKTEHDRAPTKPIYIVGESLGASLALIVAAQNPDIDLVLILANPATNFSKSLVQSIIPLSDILCKQLQVRLLHGMISSIPVETVLWKLKMIDEMQIYLNSHLHAVKAQTLILSSGKDLLLSSITEGEKLCNLLKHCEIHTFIRNGNPLFLDDNFDLVAAIKCANYYRRGTSVDIISDFLPPKPSEFESINESFIRWVDLAVDPVMCSTLGGKIVRGLAGIPSEGPVLLVGNHMMLGMDVVPLLSKFWIEQNIMLRGMAHPIFFERFKDGKLRTSHFDVVRTTGGVPVSEMNLYRLLSLKSHVLLHPGGAREVFHRKNEEHKLIWPDEAEFVRMAATFGAKIIPFGAVGEDDVLQLLIDCNDQMKIPALKALIEDRTNANIRLRKENKGEVGKQFLNCPICQPKLPGRFYFLFGKPISTEGRKDVLGNKDKAQEMYEEVRTEIEKCIAYLKEKREKDPYRNLLARSVYQAYHGLNSQVPTFDI